MQSFRVVCPNCKRPAIKVVTGKKPTHWECKSCHHSFPAGNEEGGVDTDKLNYRPPDNTPKTNETLKDIRRAKWAQPTQRQTKK